MVIVIADDDDLAVFRNCSGIRYVFSLPKQASILDIYPLLHEIERDMIPDTDDPVEWILSHSEKIIHAVDDDEPERKHILVVDDDVEQLAQIKGSLSEFYDVTAVRSGGEALRFLEGHKTDLMLLDYMMPGMNGPEILYRIRTSRANHDLPVVFLTGMTEKEKVIKTLTELKPQGYLIKPARKSEIVAKIIDVLG